MKLRLPTVTTTRTATSTGFSGDYDGDGDGDMIVTQKTGSVVAMRLLQTRIEGFFFPGEYVVHAEITRVIYPDPPAPSGFEAPTPLEIEIV
jgi:hypothetical protein